MEPDFSGYATKAGVKCADGLTIDNGAFEHQDQETVPLVWQHIHNTPGTLLGHAVLEHRADGTYTRAYFNESQAGQDAKAAVKNGDIKSLSIYANKLVKRGMSVLHGAICEVSLVLKGANPGALIDYVNLQHDVDDDYDNGEAIIYMGEADEFESRLLHSENSGDTMSTNSKELTVTEIFHAMSEEQQGVAHFMIGAARAGDEITHADVVAKASEGSDKTVKDVFDSMSEEEKNVVYFMIGEAMEENKEGGDSIEQSVAIDEEFIAHAVSTGLQEGFESMRTNIFDQQGETVLKHSLDAAGVKLIVKDAIKMGSFKDSFLTHADTYGINDIEILFPDAKTVGDMPTLIARETEWVAKVLGATKHSPMAKIKTILADLTAAEARAKGYIKGNEKKDEVIALLKRTTGPATIYKKQKLDRDDIIDITDFDIIQWLKWEIRFMLNEEIARAILIGDGRSASSEDKVKDPAGNNEGTGIRSILHDDDLYTIKQELAANVAPDVMVDEITRGRNKYRGSGNPTWYTTDTIITDMLLLKDKIGQRLYRNVDELATALRVKEIVPVEAFEETPTLIGIMVNLQDYTVGTNKGGEVSFFEDFDIDFNQNKYLMETRMSGALTKPKSAIAVTREAGILAVATAPSFNGATNTITVPTATGVDYLIDDVIVTGSVVIEKDTDIEAVAKSGYYLAPNSTKSWSFTFTEI